MGVGTHALHYKTEHMLRDEYLFTRKKHYKRDFIYAVGADLIFTFDLIR